MNRPTTSYVAVSKLAAAPLKITGGVRSNTLLTPIVSVVSAVRRPPSVRLLNPSSFEYESRVRDWLVAPLQSLFEPQRKLSINWKLNPADSPCGCCHSADAITL